MDDSDLGPDALRDGASKPRNLATMPQEELNQALSNILAQPISRDAAYEECTDLLRAAAQARRESGETEKLMKKEHIEE